MKLSIILDLVIVVILFISGWHGYRRGLILGIGGVIAMLVALWGANLVANTYTPDLTPAIHPFVSGIVEKAVDTAKSEYLPSADDSNTEVYDISLDALANLGILQSASAELAQGFASSFTETGQMLKVAITEKITETLAFAILSTTAFLLISVVFAIVLNLINIAFNLPGLKLLNDIGGAVLGLAKGLIVVLVIAWALRFTGAIIPAAEIDQTAVLRLFVEHNPITKIFGI
ncbi:MAG: CvpA family protein [Oscillospiraceae bacterium]|jgi:uncharacterized membrane protein required for colicin V production|nr:CvpA family protein [Oscillospiraceae bacterium]